MKRPVKSGIASLKALGFVVVLGAVAHAGLPYLPLIGPPPLRVRVLKNSNAAVVVKTVVSPVAVATNLPDAVGAKAFPGTTNATSTEAASTVLASFPPLADPNAGQSLEDAFSTSVFALPTPDLLSITPQMLATYFRPVQFGTNSATLVGPLHIGFMPPQPLPEKSSRAEFIVK